MPVLPPAFYHRPTRVVARALLGQVLCVRTPRGVLRARITETEAYLGVRDRAAHSFGGRRTARTEAMYLGGGHAYVYFIYGMHFCLNAVTREAGRPEAVLIRAAEPLEAEAAGAADPRRAKLLRARTDGPGKLCRFYGIGRAENGVPLFSRRSRVWIEAGSPPKRGAVLVTPRIGIDGAGEARDLLLRYVVASPEARAKHRRK